MTTISNTDDMIDSRDVIERIEELEAERKHWVAGFNMPGYMPDNEPASFETWEEARDYIVQELDRACDETDSVSDGEDYAKAARHFEALTEETDQGWTVGQYHWWITAADKEGLSDEDHAELMALRKLAAECEDCIDWKYGETLIHRSHFIDYIEQLIDECYEMPKEMKSGNWPWRHVKVDYKAAADEAEVDYISVDFDGEEYLIRCV